MTRWRLKSPPAGGQPPDWKAANPKAIAKRLVQVRARPTGGWFVLDDTRRIDKTPRRYAVQGQQVVAWKDDKDQLFVAPEACPHMGASLQGACVNDNALVCPWHGLALGPKGHGSWRHFPCHDDGVLAWVQLGQGDKSQAPYLPERPDKALSAVIRMEANCDPQDVIANRLDPWHGQHFHPYAFGALKVHADTEQGLDLRVEKRILGPLRVEVDARFHCPDARTIVMTITQGEGAGSVVETHATPLAPGRTAVIEAVLATSDRPGFALALAMAPLLRPWMRRSARRLWVDDCAYAERSYWLRQQGLFQYPDLVP